MMKREFIIYLSDSVYQQIGNGLPEVDKRLISTVESAIR